MTPIPPASGPADPTRLEHGPCGYWQDLTTTDFRQVDPARTIALLPVDESPQGVADQLAMWVR